MYPENFIQIALNIKRSLGSLPASPFNTLPIHNVETSEGEQNQVCNNPLLHLHHFCVCSNDNRELLTIIENELCRPLNIRRIWVGTKPCPNHSTIPLAATPLRILREGTLLPANVRGAKKAKKPRLPSCLKSRHWYSCLSWLHMPPTRVTERAAVTRSRASASQTRSTRYESTMSRPHESRPPTRARAPSRSRVGPVVRKPTATRHNSRRPMATAVPIAAACSSAGLPSLVRSRIRTDWISAFEVYKKIQSVTGLKLGRSYASSMCSLPTAKLWLCMQRGAIEGRKLALEAERVLC